MRAIAAAPLLAQWLNDHSQKDGDAPLWIVIADRQHGEPLNYGAARMLLRRLARKAKVKKKVNPQTFRHSRASFLANALTERQMEQYLGWVPGSRMPQIYVHLSGREVDDAILALNGMSRPETPKTVPKLRVRPCPRCSLQNEPISRFCSHCGMPLDLGAAFEAEEKRRSADEIMGRLLSDPQVKEFLLAKQASMRTYLDLHMTDDHACFDHWTLEPFRGQFGLTCRTRGSRRALGTVECMIRSLLLVACAKCLWRYSISGDMWSTLANAPNYVGYEAGALVHTGGDQIYATGGLWGFWRYTISSNGWETLTDLPERMSYGGDLAYSAGSVYATMGGYKTDFWVYSTVFNEWRSLTRLPRPPYVGSAMAYVPGDHIYALQGHVAAVDYGGFWRYQFGLDNYIIHNRAYLILPNIKGKPVAGIPVINALATDWTAAGYIAGLADGETTAYDTDPVLINLVTGSPTAPSGYGLIIWSGPVVHIAVWYYEKASGQSPIYFDYDSNQAWFTRRGVGPIAGSAVTWTELGAGARDIFVFQIFSDAQGRFVLIVYGFTWRGTFASALYFDKTIRPNMAAYTQAWYVVQWTDDGNGNVEDPGTDGYTIIASET